jgi:hypothetical protein
MGATPWFPSQPAGQATGASAQIMRQGYLITLELLNGKMRLVAAADIDNYLENRFLSADDDWFLILFNEAGESIGTQRLHNPWHFSPIVSADQAMPLVVKIPRLAGLSAVVVYDQYRQEQLRIPIENSFRSAAAIRRQRFIEHDRENARLLRERPRVFNQGTSRVASQRKDQLLFEDLPAEQQKRIREEIVLEKEHLERLGLPDAGLRDKLPAELTEVLRPIPTGAQIVVPPGGNPTDSAGTTYTLSGQLTDLDTGLPLAFKSLDFYQYDNAHQYQAYLGKRTTNAQGRYSITVSPGYVSFGLDWNSALASRYFPLWNYVKIAGDTTADLKAAKGSLLTGIVTNTQNQGVVGAVLQIQIGVQYLYSTGSYTTTTSSTGSYTMMVPANRPITLSLAVPAPYVSPQPETGVVFSSDAIRNFTLDTGWQITGTVKGEGDAPLAKASILVKQLTATTVSPVHWNSVTDASGKYALILPKNLEPNSFVIVAYASQYLQQAAGLSITGDVTQNFQLVRGNIVSGTVSDDLGTLQQGVRVRAYQEGNLVTAALTDANGAYSFTLASGAYDFDVVPAPGSTLAPKTASIVTVSEPCTMNYVLSPAAGILTVHLFFPDVETYTRFSDRVLNRFELYQGSTTVYASSASPDDGGLDPARGKYFRNCLLYVNPGRYTLTAFLNGCNPITLPDLHVAGQTTVSLDVPEPFRWNGVLRRADGTPLPNMSIVSYNDIAKDGEWTTTDASGRFSTLLTPNGFAKFFADGNSSNILHTERFGDVTASRNADCVLDALRVLPDTGGTLVQLYGTSDKQSRWNIVMIGDGYTDIIETYTDLNGNGQWDGVIYYDLNQNGVWDAAEPYQCYGNAPPPTAGQDPTLSSEPFPDLNGDGVPNIHDQEVFDRNTIDTIRSLFGQDEWWRYRNAFNIYRIRVISRQAGLDIMDQSGNTIISRDTAFDAYASNPAMRYPLWIDPMLAAQYIQQYVPECDTRIVLLNQPIQMGRPNAFIITHGGEYPALCNAYEIAHEMAHNLALVGDEYADLPGTYVGMEPSYPNVTTFRSWDRIPWRHLITPQKEIPSMPGSAGVGLYQGGGYYAGGYYRPTEHCMMVRGDRFCPVCTEQIEQRMMEVMGSIPDAVPRAPLQVYSGLYPEFLWDAVAGVSHYQLELEKADGSQLIASFDVYDTSFTLPFALAENNGYRWRIRAGSGSRWGNWSSWVNFTLQSSALAFTTLFAHIAAGGNYSTTLIGMNPGSVPASALAYLVKSDGTPLDPANPEINLNIEPMGIVRLATAASEQTVSGYARLTASAPIDGTVLFQNLSDNQVLGEAAVLASMASKNFIICVDNENDAASAYALTNGGAESAHVTLTLRDKNGGIVEIQNLTLAAGCHLAEYAYQRFAGASTGFVGSIELASDQDLAAVALRFDNPEGDVFSTIPVIGDELVGTLYFPQFADGSGYQTDFILANPSDTAASAQIEFFSNDGTPIVLPIGGIMGTIFSVDLRAHGTARFFTDGTSAGVVSGWAKVSAAAPLAGTAIFQVRLMNRILAEAGVGSSPLAQHFLAYVDSTGSSQSGIALCNPNPYPVTLTLSLHRPSGATAASTSLDLPASGHIARFFGEWFPRGFGEFEGVLEVLASAPISAVALRYDNPQQNVFATLPVVVIR